jgi:6,7-dimethyl-8-ribityllumazine synthase
MKETKGRLVAHAGRLAIVVSRFNELITKNLLHGALDILTRYGMQEQQIHIVWVPGAFEIPLIANKLALKKEFEAIICLGAVIRGATPHFDYVCNQVASGISHVSSTHQIPVIFGILTTNTIEQAIERAGTKAGNKGAEAAQTALEMIDIIDQLKIEIEPSPLPYVTHINSASERGLQTKV